MDADNAVAQTTATPLARPRQQHAPVGYIEFFRQHMKTVKRAVMYVGATEQEADDAIQDAMISVLLNWADIGNPSAYAIRAAINSFYKTKRVLTGHLRAQQEELRVAAAATRRSAAALTAWEDRQWVQQLLSELPPKQREVMTFVIEGFKPAEIAELLGRSPEAIRQSLKDARTRLTQMIDIEQAADHGAGSMGKEAR